MGRFRENVEIAGADVSWCLKSPEMKLLLSIALAGLILSGCQKEIDWGLNSGSDGDLLISSLEVTRGTNDTKRISLTWDGSNLVTEDR